MDQRESAARASDWPRIAAWVFGIWSLMVPLSAAIIVSAQNRAIDNQEKIRLELTALRAEVLQMNGLSASNIAAITTRQMDIMRRVDLLEQRHLANHESN